VALVRSRVVQTPVPLERENAELPGPPLALAPEGGHSRSQLSPASPLAWLYHGGVQFAVASLFHAAVAPAVEAWRCRAVIAWPGWALSLASVMAAAVARAVPCAHS
jgi:hypothetical protein